MMCDVVRSPLQWRMILRLVPVCRSRLITVPLSEALTSSISTTISPPAAIARRLPIPSPREVRALTSNLQWPRRPRRYHAPHTTTALVPQDVDCRSPRARIHSCTKTPPTPSLTSALRRQTNQWRSPRIAVSSPARRVPCSPTVVEILRQKWNIEGEPGILARILSMLRDPQQVG